MTFTATQILFLQRLISERPAERHAGKAALFFSEHFSLGRISGGNVRYDESHFRDAESILKAHDLPIEPLGSQANRSTAAQYGGLSEKKFSEAPHARSVAVKFIGTCTLNGLPISTPEGSYMVVYPDIAKQITCQRIWLVENLEPFRTLEQYAWLGMNDQTATMVVFRGDPSLSTGSSMNVIRDRAEPVWAFVDFDPAGLSIANTLPHERLQRIMLPALQWLKGASATHRGKQLFSDQVNQYASTLNGSTHPGIKHWWREMLMLQSAVTQERMIGATKPESEDALQKLTDLTQELGLY
jgi:hypothetical protein